jgi:hypothetical protein
MGYLLVIRVSRYYCYFGLSPLYSKEINAGKVLPDSCRSFATTTCLTGG